MTTTQTKVIDEIRSITGDAVAKKQDAAKNNFPNILEKIKAAAKQGNSEAYISQFQMNEYDKRLLQAEGFSVNLVSSPFNADDFKQLYGQNTKMWRISW